MRTCGGAQVPTRDQRQRVQLARQHGQRNRRASRIAIYNHRHRRQARVLEADSGAVAAVLVVLQVAARVLSSVLWMASGLPMMHAGVHACRIPCPCAAALLFHSSNAGCVHLGRCT